MEAYIIPMAILGATGLISALILYFVAKRFAVHEDERISIVESILPGANCGACGRKGCHDFAVACCEAGSLEGLACPGAGNEGMAKIAKALGLAASEQTKKIAILGCNGTCDNLLNRREMTAFKSCHFVRTLSVAPDVCQWGCIGCGDCVKVCNFGAILINPSTGIAEISTDKCTGCGICATTCPQGIIEIREVKPSQMTWVRCSNRDRGAIARRECKAACIGCGKCVRTCHEKAISLTENHAIINGDICIGCGKCAEACPTNAIVTTSLLTI